MISKKGGAGKKIKEKEKKAQEREQHVENNRRTGIYEDLRCPTVQQLLTSSM